ncbi:hypothetical protein IV203_034877 [Nitzschia inconspicua]|uniref:Uncharacterized protein n=1 Tax=Nitzschia inconspicua TaxID=303405 RepID=A0A9K3LCH4_9STRA|nr:hypothetical protein IV203_034877 [Nitzschia inconspicua]
MFASVWHSMFSVIQLLPKRRTEIHSVGERSNGYAVRTRVQQESLPSRNRTKNNLGAVKPRLFANSHSLTRSGREDTSLPFVPFLFDTLSDEKCCHWKSMQFSYQVRFGADDSDSAMKVDSGKIQPMWLAEDAYDDRGNWTDGLPINHND